jgi:hypothetical protein
MINSKGTKTAKVNVQVVATGIKKGLKKEKRMPTSIHINEELWDEVKIAAIKKKITATEFLETALKRELQRDKSSMSAKESDI